MTTQVSGYIGRIDPGNGTNYALGSTAYGYCETAAATAAKVVDMTGFTLVTGATIHVKMKYSNTAANPTLNVNSTGAKSIKRYGTTAPSTSAITSWNAEAVVGFTYDGTYWMMNDNMLAAASSHTHDDRYYTESEVDTLLSAKSNATQDAHHTYFVKGTQTASTGSWTGVLSDVDALYDGLTIDYWLPFAGSGNATLNLTLKDGSTTGAINCYSGGAARLTTHIAANWLCRLMYQTVTISGTSYTGWWLVRSIDTNDTASALFRYGNYVANSIIYRFQMLFSIDDDTVTPLNNVSNNTGTTKTMLTNVEFDPFKLIYYWNSTSTIQANDSVLATTCRYAAAFDIRYTFNCGSTLTAHKPVYLQVSLQSSGKVKLASASPLVQTLPSTNDGYYYIYLGRMYSTTNIGLTPFHPIFYHDGTGIRQYYGIPEATTTASGLMSATDKTKLNSAVTTVTPATESIGSATAGTAISADDITAWSAGSTPTLGTAISADDITAWSAGTVPTATVTGETLVITAGTAPSLSYTARSIPNVTDVGTAPSLSYTARSIPNISVTTKTVVTGVAAS